MSQSQPQPIPSTLTTNWWAMSLRGVAALLFGSITLSWPGMTLLVLIAFFGWYTVIDGIFAIVAGIRGEGGRRWLLLAEGALGVLVGLVIFFYPGITAVILLYVIAAWAIFTGILRVVLAISLRSEIENEWLFVSGGVLSVLFGVILAVWPKGALLTLVWLIGIYLLIVGIVLIYLGFRVRGQRASESRRVT